MISEEKFQKNYEILKNYWISEIDDTLKNIRKSLKTFFSGLFGWFFNKFVIFAYNFFLSPDIREKSITQLDPVLDGAKLLDTNNFNEVIESYFDEFKKNDLGFYRCRHKSKKFPDLIEKMKQNYIARIRETKTLLLSNGDCYSELVRNAYKTKENATEAMIKTLDLAKDALDFSVENNLLNITSLIKSQTLRLLYGELEYKQKDFEDKIERIFSGENF